MLDVISGRSTSKQPRRDEGGGSSLRAVRVKMLCAPVYASIGNVVMRVIPQQIPVY